MPRNLSRNALIVFDDATFDRVQGRDRLFPQSAYQIEPNPRIKNFLRKLLKREQIDRLLLQLIDSLAPSLGNRLKHGGRDYVKLPGLLSTQNQKGKDHGRGVRDDDQWTGLQLQLQILSKLALDPGGPYACCLLVLEGEREIQNGAAAVSSLCPA